MGRGKKKKYYNLIYIVNIKILSIFLQIYMTCAFILKPNGPNRKCNCNGYSGPASLHLAREVTHSDACKSRQQSEESPGINGGKGKRERDNRLAGLNRIPRNGFGDS